MPLVLACVLVLILLLSGMLYFRSRNKQLCGYNQIPLHPVYPFGVCCALLTICFWLAVYTKLPGWFHTLAGLAVVTLAVILACYLCILTPEWRRHMRQRVVRGHVSNKHLTAELQRRPSSRYLHQQRPRLQQRPSTKAFGMLDARGVPREETIALGNSAHNLQLTEAKELRMSKLRVPLFDFLWVWCARRPTPAYKQVPYSSCSHPHFIRLFVAPNAILLWTTGVAHLLLRQWLVRKGWIRRVDFSASQAPLPS